jgi:hypothetical protein
MLQQLKLQAEPSRGEAEVARINFDHRGPADITLNPLIGGRDGISLHGDRRARRHSFLRGGADDPLWLVAD